MNDRANSRRALLFNVAALATVAAGLSLHAGASFATNNQHPGWLKPHGEATVNSINRAKRTINITHGPVMALNWPGMTMEFSVAPDVDLAGVRAGSKIHFTLTRGADGMYVIDRIEPSE